MEEKKSNKKFYILSIIIAILVVAIIIGTSYAYFTANIAGNNSATTSVITSGNMALELEDGEVIGTTQNMIPGDKIQKKFKVRNIGSLPTTYNIYLSEVVNTFADKSDLVYRLISEDGGYNTTSDIEVPSISGEQSKIITNKLIDANQEHNYTLEIEFLNKNENQDDNKGKAFSTKLQINEYKNIALLETGEEINRKMTGIAVIENCELLYQIRERIENGEIDVNDLPENWEELACRVETGKNNITSIQRTTTLDENATKELISTEKSPSPVYIWFDNGTVYYYSELEKIILNPNSSHMFEDFEELSSIDLSGFDSSIVNDMSYMFRNTALTSLNLSSFNTSNVTNMSSMFSGMESLTDLNISTFNTSNVENMSSMFSGMESLESLNLSSFNTSKVTNMSYMFQDLKKITELDLNSFDTSKVTNMEAIFSGMELLTDLNISSIDTSNVENMSRMFYKCSSLDQIDIESIDISKVTDVSYMFSNTALTSIDLSSWDTSNIISTRYIFENSKIEEINISGWDFTNNTDYNPLSCVTSSENGSKVAKRIIARDLKGLKIMNRAFANSFVLEYIDLTGTDTSQVTTFYEMFKQNYLLKRIDGLETLNTSNVVDMGRAFYGCKAIEELNLLNWNTSNVTDMGYMFTGAETLQVIDLSSFNTSNVTNMSTMFCECSNVETIYVGNDWNTSNATNSYGLFNQNYKLVGGAGTVFDANHYNIDYAHVDGGPSNPGYFTLKTN